MIRRQPRSTRTDTLFPYTTLFQSLLHQAISRQQVFGSHHQGSWVDVGTPERLAKLDRKLLTRSEEHTSELQSLMRISFAVFFLKKKRIISNRQLPIV